MKIAIGNDYTGVRLKNVIVAHLAQKGYEVINLGIDVEEDCYYAEYGRKVAHEIISGKADLGIVICGTGIGISLAANKVNGIRAAVCSEPLTAKLSREHNNANIIAFGSRVVGDEMAKMIVDSWLETKFEGGRHEKRVEMIEPLIPKKKT